MGESHQLGSLESGVTLSFVAFRLGAWGLRIGSPGGVDLVQAEPVRLELYRDGVASQVSAGYAALEQMAEGFVGRADLTAGPGSVVHVEDSWSVAGAVVSVVRRLVVEGEAPGGFYSAILLATQPQVTWPDINFYAPGLLYGDPTYDGERSPGGTLAYEARRFGIREDFFSAPMFALSFRNGTSVTALDPAPKGDTTLQESCADPEPALIDERFCFGALGAHEAADGGVEFGFWLPGTVEQIPWREGPPECQWRRRYHPLRDGLTQEYSVLFRLGQNESFRDMTRNTFRWAWAMLKPQVNYLDMEVVRRTLIDHLAERVQTIEGRTGIPFMVDTTTGRIGVWRPKLMKAMRAPDQPAEDVTWWSRAVLGFVGKNVEGAVELLYEAERDPGPRGARLRQLGLAIIDSFIRLVPMTPPRGAGFNIVTGENSMTNPHWHKWYLRAPAEDMRMLMDAYRREREAGREHPDWIRWCREFADWVMAQQRDDGSFPRAWSSDTSEVVEPSGTTSYNPVPLFVRLSQETGEEKYLQSALRAAEYVWASFGTQGVFVGGAIDNPNIVDKEAGMLSLEAFLALYEATQEPKWLQRAQVAADYAETWIWLWNVPMPEDADDADLHWKKGVPTTGLQGITALAASFLDEYMDWSTGAYAKLYSYTQDPHYLDVARVLLHDTKAMLALPGRSYDMLGPGWQQEHFGMAINIRGYGHHRSWLPWVSTNHLFSIIGLEDYSPELFARLSKPE